MYTLLNITKTVTLAYAVTSLPCPHCGETTTIEIAPEKLFLYNQGARVQDVLSGFDVDVRERFITGICLECWNELFDLD